MLIKQSKLPSHRQVEKAKKNLAHLEAKQEKAMARWSLDQDSDIFNVFAWVGILGMLAICAAICISVFSLHWALVCLYLFLTFVLACITGGYLPWVLTAIIWAPFSVPQMIWRKVKIERDRKTAAVPEKLLNDAVLGLDRNYGTPAHSMKEKINQLQQSQFALSIENLYDFLQQWRKEALDLRTMEVSLEKLVGHQKEYELVEEAISKSKDNLQILTLVAVREACHKAVARASTYLDETATPDEAPRDLALMMEASKLSEDLRWELESAIAKAKELEAEKQKMEKLIEAAPGLRIALEKKAMQELAEAS